MGFFLPINFCLNYNQYGAFHASVEGGLGKFCQHLVQPDEHAALVKLLLWSERERYFNAAYTPCMTRDDMHD